jgi:predicted nucleotidyltransferase
MIDYEKMMTHVKSHPFPLVFATISGAHLYGFPSPDSDFDLRGVHLLPLQTVLSLDDGQQTVEKEGIYDGLEIDLVTHDWSHAKTEWLCARTASVPARRVHDAGA